MGDRHGEDPMPGVRRLAVDGLATLALLTIRAAMHRLDPQIEEAARGMGRSGFAVYREVILPQLAPAIGAALKVAGITVDATAIALHAPITVGTR